MHRGNPLSRIGIPLLLCLIHTGSFAADQGTLDPAGVQPTQPPARIAVADFSVNADQVHGDRERLPGRLLDRLPILDRRAPLIRRYDSPEALANAVVNEFSESLVSALQAFVPAARVNTGNPPPANAWLVKGRFDAIDQGKLATQSVIGFGAGDPKILVSGGIFDLGKDADTPFLVFGDDSRKSRTPGAILTKNPYVLAAKLVLASEATERDVEKLAKHLAEEIQSYMVTHGLMP